MTTEPKRIDVNDLKVGDVVCITKNASYGWNTFYRYPMYLKTVVERITPKKTKVITKEYGEFNTKYSHFYEPSEETERKTLVAKAYRYILASVDSLSRNPNIRQLSDEDLIEVANKLNEVREIVDKYSKKED